MVLVNGGCHCGRVRWAASVPRDAVVVTCSCSVCVKKSNVHVILPKARFDLVSGESELTCYRFNTMQAQHLFCKHCGTQSFYVPRSNPDGIGINPHCIDEADAKQLTLGAKSFDGRDWEGSIDSSGIRSLSKL